MNRRGGDNIDDFIASEMQQIDGSAGESKPTMRPSGPGTGVKGGALSSKPNFGFSSKKAGGGGTFAKPSFAGGAIKKTAGPMIVPKTSITGASGPSMGLKRKQKDDDFIENELQNI